MSDLEQLCAALERTCQDGAAVIDDLLRLRVRMLNMSTEIARLAAAGDGSGAHLARTLQLELAEAMRRCSDAAASMRQMQGLGRQFIDRTVGGGGLTQRGVDHVQDGQLNLRMEGGQLHAWLSGGHFLGGRFHLEKLQVDADSGVSKVRGGRLTLSAVATAELNEILDILVGQGLDAPPKKDKGSTFYPIGWAREACEAAFTAAWSDPSGTRDAGAGRWSGTGYGLRIEGFYNPETGELVSAWPVLRRGDRR